MQIAADAEVAVAFQQQLRGAARVGVRGVAETLEISLEQHAEIAETIRQSGIVLHGAHALRMRQNHRQPQRLKPSKVRREEFRQLVRPEVDQAEPAIHSEGDDQLRNGSKQVRLNVVLPAGEKLQRNVLSIEFGLQRCGHRGDVDDGVRGQARPDMRRAEGVRVAALDEQPRALDRFFEGLAAVVDAGKQMRMNVNFGSHG